MTQLLSHNKCFIFLLLLFVSVGLQGQSQINISGENTALYIYRTAKDSLNHYFENELSVRVDHRNFTFGMSFLAEMPRYDSFGNVIDELHPEQIGTQWTDRYIQITYDDLFLKAGTIEESFGKGVVLRIWRDDAIDHDNRVEGVQSRFVYDDLKLAAIYGAIREDKGSLKQNDLVIGFDAGYQVASLSIGASALQYKSKLYSSYAHTNIFGTRLGMTTSLFDLSAEYSELIPTHNNAFSLNGSAIYSSANIFLGDFTVTTGYKRYNRYAHFPLADLPTLNHYDELLSSVEYVDTDFEEGLMGEVVYLLNPEHEFTIHYAEAWDRRYDIRHSNFFGEYKGNLNSFSYTIDYEHIERLLSDAQLWNKELRPSVRVDFNELPISLGTKLLWSYTEEEHYDEKKVCHRPYLLVDTKPMTNLSVALFGEYQFTGSDDFGKNSVWLGTEIVTQISDHTELKLFAGKEKGGKVCRNGVCQIQSPFEGIKLSLNTRF